MSTTENAVPITFETFLPPAFKKNGDCIPYDIAANPELTSSMMEKIDVNIRKFGTLEAFMERFQVELIQFHDMAQKAVQTYEMRKRQMDFIIAYAAKHAVEKSNVLDP